MRSKTVADEVTSFGQAHPVVAASHASPFSGAARIARGGKHGLTSAADRGPAAIVSQLRAVRNLHSGQVVAKFTSP
jgi:hypothetical protein